MDSPAPEGTQQLVISALQLVPPLDKDLDAVPEMPPPWGKNRLLVKAQSNDLGLNGKRTIATHFMWPRRGHGARTGSRRLTKLDKFLERLLGYVPEPGSYPVEELIGMNFISTVVRRRGLLRYRGEVQYHPIAKFEVEDCRFGCGVRPLYDNWPSWTPLYTLHDQERIFVPGELQEAKV